MTAPKWTVPATVIRIIDGDTIEVTLDLGWKMYKTDSVRFADINAPEKNTDAGKKAAAFLTTLVKPGDKVTIQSHKLDKYGRCLATITVDKMSISLNERMLSSGNAVPFMVDS
jgi:micrococcal nuclease